jgi:broad specificity phosphatase PhoE
MIGLYYETAGIARLFFPEIIVRLILVRHGETGGNPSARLQGRTDLGLSRIGRAQAQAAGQALRGEALGMLVASDMKRARETADIIAGCQAAPVPVVLDSRLREVDLGLWEGMTLEEVRRTLPGELEQWLGNPRATPPDGEPSVDVGGRVSRFVTELLSSRVNTVAIVAHLLVFQVLICTLMHIPPAARYPFHLYTGSLSELRVEEGSRDGAPPASLVYLNRLSHLAEAGLDVESIRDR